MMRLGLYYKHIAIINYDLSIVNKLIPSPTDNARVIIHMFIVQATSLLHPLSGGINLTFTSVQNDVQIKWVFKIYQKCQ